MFMQFRKFQTIESLIAEGVNLLNEHMQIRSETPHAIMLSGGHTPLPIYDSIAEHPFPVSDQLYIMMSDERMVPDDSPDNNLAETSRMLRTLGIPPAKILKVHTNLSSSAAADRYNNDIANFFTNKGRLTLALLGLGTDGHTASIFSPDDLMHTHDKFAIAVPHAPSFERISSTPRTITSAERIVFLAVGKEKEKIVSKFQNNPDLVIAGQVVKNASNIELWFAIS